MMTEQEKERMKLIQDGFGHITEVLEEAFGDAVDPSMFPIVLGNMMGAVDAMFAIRDGQSWRGMTDPKDIARRLLRDAKLGD